MMPEPELIKMHRMLGLAFPLPYEAPLPWQATRPAPASRRASGVAHTGTINWTERKARNARNKAAAKARRRNRG